MADRKSSESVGAPAGGEREIALTFPSFRHFVDQYSARVSGEGMFIESSEPLEVGADVDFEVRLADGFRLLSGSGEVVWKVDAGTSDDWTPGMAIRFREIDDSTRRLVSRLVRNCRERGVTPFSLVRWPVEPVAPPPPADPFPEIESPPAAAAPVELTPEAPPAEPAEAATPSAVQPQEEPLEAAARPPLGEGLETVAAPLVDLDDLDLAGGLADSEEEVSAEPVFERPPPETGPALDLRAWDQLLAAEPLDEIEPRKTEPRKTDPEKIEVDEIEPPEEAPPAAPPPEPELAAPPATADESLEEIGLTLEASEPEPEPSEDMLQPELDAATDEWTRAEREIELERERAATTAGSEQDFAAAVPPAVPAAEPGAGSLESPEQGPIPIPEETPRPPTLEPRAAQARKSLRERFASPWLRLALLLAILAAVIFAGLYYRDSGRLETAAPIPAPAVVPEPAPIVAQPAEVLDDDGSSADDPSEVAEVPPPPPQPVAPARVIERVAWRVEDGATILVLIADGPLDESRFEVFRVGGGANPREVIRINGIEQPFRTNRVAVGTPHIERVRVGLHGEQGARELHFVVDLADPAVRASEPTIVDRSLRVRFARDPSPR